MQAAKIIDAAWSRNFLDAVVHGKYPNIFAQDFDAVIRDGDMELIQAPSDFVGINHYNPYFARHDDSNVIGAVITEGPDHHPRTDIGWVFQPESFRDALLDLKDNKAQTGAVKNPEQLKNLEYSFGGPEPITKYLLKGIPGSANFFVSGEFSLM